MLPPMGEAEIVHAAVPEGASILELGCGTGRILRVLASLGHPVRGADDSPGMLAHAAGLPVTCSPIESLRLEEKFGVVLLASNMLNAGPGERRAFLATCAHHLSGGGVAVFQYHTPAWFDIFPSAPRESALGEITTIIRSCHRAAHGIECQLEYQAGDRAWTHSWTSYQVTDEDLSADLAAAGLAFSRWLTDGPTAWFTARLGR